MSRTSTSINQSTPYSANKSDKLTPAINHIIFCHEANVKDMLPRYVTRVCCFRPLESRDDQTHECRCTVRALQDSSGIIRTLQRPVFFVSLIFALSDVKVLPWVTSTVSSLWHEGIFPFLWFKKKVAIEKYMLSCHKTDKIWFNSLKCGGI